MKNTHLSINQRRVLPAALLALLAASSAAQANTSYTLGTPVVPSNPAPGSVSVYSINDNNTVAGSYSILTNTSSVSPGFVGAVAVPSAGNTPANMYGGGVVGLNNNNQFIANSRDLTVPNRRNGFEGLYYSSIGASPLAIMDTNTEGSSVVNTYLVGISTGGGAGGANAPLLVGYDQLKSGDYYNFIYDVGTNTYTDFSFNPSNLPVSDFGSALGVAAISSNGEYIAFNYTSTNPNLGQEAVVFDTASQLWSAPIADPNQMYQNTNGLNATGINNLGEIVGFFTDASGITHSFAFNFVTNTWISQQLDYPNSTDTEVTAVNNNGVLAGIDNTNHNYFIATPVSSVPLPGALWLMSSSLAGLGLLNRRRRA